MSEETPATPLKKRPAGLGRGLSALLGEIEREAPVALDGVTPEGVRMVEVNRMRPLPNQPRKNFDDAALDELAESIRSRGMLQPIVVRDPDHDGHYEIIAGERRWRAAQRAQIHQVPVIIREFDDITALEVAIIENIQREQLNAWEEGEAYRRLIDDHGHTQEALGRIVGKSRSHVANLMRLRNLPLPVHGWLTAGQITMGHARALLGVAAETDLRAAARDVIARGLSVRETESLVRRTEEKAKASLSAAVATADVHTRAAEDRLRLRLGTRVRIVRRGKKGRIEVDFGSEEELIRLFDLLMDETEPSKSR